MTRADFASWIVWKDEHLLAVDKPSGILSQGGEGGAGQNLVDLSRAYLGREAGVGVLHRLDRNVSGLVLISYSPAASRAMVAAFAEGRVERAYTAIVLGAPPRKELVIDAPIAKNERTNEVVAISNEELEGLDAATRERFKPARTEATVRSTWKARLGACAELEVRPITGRSHQIRAHLAFVGLPIVGDPKYGVEADKLRRPLLHAHALSFVHPLTKETISLSAPPPWPRAQLEALRPRASDRARGPERAGDQTRSSARKRR